MKESVYEPIAGGMCLRRGLYMLFYFNILMFWRKTE